MGSFAVAALIAGAALIGTITVDVGVNTVQNYYEVFYADALWSSRDKNSPVLDHLAREEAEINRLLHDNPEFSSKQVMLRPPATQPRQQ